MAATTSALLLLTPAAARAFELWTDGTDSLRWDTTLAETSAFRLNGADAALLGHINSDDADRSFRAGNISDRSDLFTEMDYTRGNFGMRGSFAGWYDLVYLGRTANNSPGTFNPVSVPNDQFPRAVRSLQGLGGEVLDAFAQDRITLDDHPITVRLGRHTLIWGESLFFGGNGIAAGQAPLDLIRARSVPTATAKELFLPVAQASVTAQLAPGLALEAYNQFEWRRDRLPGVGSYFSETDILDAGGERILLGGGRSLARGPDQRPPGGGQFGLALRGTAGDATWSLDALRYSAREPSVVAGTAGTYRLVFPRDIGIYGASLSTLVGEDTLAGEVSVRQNAPLQMRAPAGAAGSAIARGDTLHGQVSLIAQWPPGPLWDSADLSAELAANQVLSVTEGAALRDPSTTDFAAAAEVQAALHYYHVRPALDVTPSVTITQGLLGRSSVDPSLDQHVGEVTVAAVLDYRTVWHARAQYTHFIGSARYQLLADRDFIALSLARSF